MLEAHLVDAIDRIDPVPYRGRAYRHQAARWHPLSGAGARSQGGRWNPPQSFATLYLALSRETAVAEFVRMAQRNGRTPQDFVPRRLYRYDVELETVLDLRSAAALGTVGLSRDDLTSDDLRACQAVGEAAQYLGREGIQASSATGNGEILAVFVDRLQPGSTVDAAAFEVWEAPPTSDE